MPGMSPRLRFPGAKRANRLNAHTSAIIYNSTPHKPCQWPGVNFLGFFARSAAFSIKNPEYSRRNAPPRRSPARQRAFTHHKPQAEENELNPANILIACRISVLCMIRALARPGVPLSPSPSHRPVSGSSECPICRRTRSPSGRPRRSARSGSSRPGASRTEAPRAPTGRRPESRGWC